MRGIENDGWRFVAFVRLVPLFPFNVLNYALGLTRIRLRAYVLTSLVCMVPGAAAYAYLGHAGREAAQGAGSALQSALVGLALVAAAAYLLPRLARRLRGPDRIAVDELRARLESGGARPTLLDVRGRDEFCAAPGHIPGAVCLPVEELPERPSALELFRRAAEEIVVVCKTDKRSTRAAQSLTRAGLRGVRVLVGGVDAWHRAGHPMALCDRRSVAEQGESDAHPGLTER